MTNEMPIYIQALLVVCVILPIGFALLWLVAFFADEAYRFWTYWREGSGRGIGKKR